MSPPRRPEAGLTLVEMLVALAIFALVGLASFAMLDTVIRTRDRTEGRLEAVAALDRALILFGRDLAQSDPGSQALRDGVLTFSRGGGEGVLRMAYESRDGALLRQVENPDGEPVEQALVAGLAGMGLRLLDTSGDWHETWPEEAAEDDAALAGVELRLDLDAAGTAPSTVHRLVELPLGVLP